MEVSILHQTSSTLNSEVVEGGYGINDEKMQVISNTHCDVDENEVKIWSPVNETKLIPRRLPKTQMNIQNIMLQASQKKKPMDVFNNSSMDISPQNDTEENNTQGQLSAKIKFGMLVKVSKKVQQSKQSVNKKKLTKKDLVEKEAKQAKKSISSVFDFEDDPMVLEIMSRNEQENYKLAVREKVEIKRRKWESPAKISEFSKCLVGSPSSDASCQEFSSDDENEPKCKIQKIKKSIKKKSTDPSQLNINFFFKNGVKASKREDKMMDLEEIQDNAPSIDELLKLPNIQEASGKAKDEVLDNLDKEIAVRKIMHEKEMVQVDIDIAAEKMRQDERRKRMKSNASERDRLEVEVTEVVLRRMFKDNLDYLKKIQSGQIESSRHQAYNKSCRSRHALYFNMITDPFTDDQLDWTLDEIAQVWMRNKKEQMDCNEYVWKVLLPECFIKFYMDHFKVSKEEAKKRISETPLRGEEDSDEDEEKVFDKDKKKLAVKLLL